MNDQDQATHANETAVHAKELDAPHETKQSQDELSQATGEATGDAAGEAAGTTATGEPTALAKAQAQLAEATARMADLAAKLHSEAFSRQLREALEDAGAVRVREALRSAMALASSPSADAGQVSNAIERVRAAHPEFFEHVRWPTTNAPSTEGEPSSKDSVSALAARARATNDRRALLDYLRARRAK